MTEQAVEALHAQIHRTGQKIDRRVYALQDLACSDGFEVKVIVDGQ